MMRVVDSADALNAAAAKAEGVQAWLRYLTGAFALTRPRRRAT